MKHRKLHRQAGRCGVVPVKRLHAAEAAMFTEDSQHAYVFPSIENHGADRFAAFHQIESSLMRSRGSVCVIKSSMLSLPSIYQSTIFGTSVRPRAPPKAEPFQTRPVTSWNGRVLISSPEAATPIMIDCPQPLWQHSSACRIVVV